MVTPITGRSPDGDSWTFGQSKTFLLTSLLGDSILYNILATGLKGEQPLVPITVALFERDLSVKKILRITFIVLGSLVAVLVVIWLAAHLFTGSSQWARAIVWLQSDIQDYKRFPAREVPNAGPVFNFKQPSTQTNQRIAAALENITYIKNGQAVTESLDKFLAANDTVAFLIIQDDEILYEKYFNGYTHDSIVTSFSMAKSFDSALVGAAIADGYIAGLDDPVTKYVPELLEKNPRYANITLRNLVSMSSGICYSEMGMPWSDDASTYYNPNLRQVAISSPICNEPGEEFLYNNFHPLLIGLVLERATGRPVAQYLSEKIWQPLGMEAPATWSLDSNQNGFEKMESGINGRAIDFAKFGRLFLNNGNWDGRQILPASWVEESTRLDTTTDPALYYQYFWWVNPITDDHQFYAAGMHGQYIYIIPEQNMILMRFGSSDPLHGAWSRELFGLLAQQIEQSNP